MYLEKNGGTIYYEVRGKEANPPLILIHGLIVDAAFYEETASLLAEDYRVLTFDRKGVSRSAGSEDMGEFSVKEQAEVICELMDHLHMEHADIVGCSAGGAVALAFLLVYPERAGEILLYEPALYDLVMDEALSRWLHEVQELTGSRRMASAVLKCARHVGAADPHSIAEKTQETFARETGNYLRALSVEQPGLASWKPDWQKVKEFSDRIHIAAGERSGDTSYVCAALRLGELLGKEVSMYPGCHNFALEQPARFATCVKKTLKRHCDF